MTAPFASRTDALSWLQTHGITHVSRFNLEAAAPFLPPELWPELHKIGGRRRLLDLASVEWIRLADLWLPMNALRSALLEAIPRLFEAERADAEAARAAPPRPAPVEAGHRALYDRLLVLRARVPSAIAPRPAARLDLDRLRFDAALPGFRFVDTQACEARTPTTGAFVRPEVKLVLAEGAEGANCACGDNACVHALAAVDLALLWLEQPDTPKKREALDRLARPAWERTLAALDEALAESPAERAGIELVWRIGVVEHVGVEVTPWVHKRNKSGQRAAATAYTRRRLLMEHGPRLSAEDARIAALLPEDERFASRGLLEALMGHPELFQADAPERTVQIDRAPLGIVAEARNASVRVTLGIDGAGLPPALMDRVRRARPEDVLFLWDSRRLTLLDVRPELRAMLEVLHRQGELFPPESQAALLESLTKWAQVVPVAMPRSIRGETVPSRITAVLRLEAHKSGWVQVELRVRPLVGGPCFAPGQGLRDVHVRREAQTFHTQRNLKAEVTAILAFSALLPLDGAERTEGRFTFRYPSAHGALELLATAGAMAEPPELEWIGPPLRNLGSAGARALTLSLNRRREWFGVLGELVVGGERMELARLLDTARRQERYLQVDPLTYVELDDALRRHLLQLADHTQVARHGLQLGSAAASAIIALELAGAKVDADVAWRGLIARIEAAESWAPALPSTLQAALRPYQMEGFTWMARLATWGAGGVLADDMGLGKTVQSLALLLARAELGPALVVAPTSVAYNWQEEAARFAPSLRVHLYGEAEDRTATIGTLGAADVLIVSYGLLVRDVAALATCRFATVIFDEAQNLKNAQTQRARAARALDAEVKFALSGTPIENHVSELWSLYSVIFPVLLGPWDAFRARHALPIERQIDPNAAPALARVIAPFLLRRTKAQVETELPPRTEVRVPVVLSSAEWQLYEDARLATLSDLESDARTLEAQERRIEVLAALTRLRLLCCHPRLYDAASNLPSAKLARLMELVEELGESGQRALVFSQFTSLLALVRTALDALGIAYGYLDGQTPAGARGAQVRAFQTGTAPLFLLSLKAGGVGLNLTAATTVIHLDPWWNPSVEDQASDRAHRLGQTRPVTIYRLVAMGTIEEQMLSLHEDKRALVARVLDGSDLGARLSTRELVGILGGSPENFFGCR